MRTFSDIVAQFDSIRGLIDEKLIDTFMKRADPEPVLSDILTAIVNECGVSGYLFTYSATHLSSHYGKPLEEALESIYRKNFDIRNRFLEYIEPCESRLRSFAAFYTLATYYFDYNLDDKTSGLFCDTELDPADYFSDFPLYYNLRARYDKRNENEMSETHLNMALSMDRQSLEMLRNEKCDNVGVRCSFASTVCKMIERGYFISGDNLGLALDCIQFSIQFNDTYAKYHSIYGMLLLYRARIFKDDAEAGRLIDEAIAELQRALETEDPRRRDYRNRYAAYNEQLRLAYSFKAEHTAKPRSADAGMNAISADSIGQCQANIRESASFEASFKPAGYTGGKPYIFVCYSRMDYKTVLCDMCEFALAGIRFQYDKGGSVTIGNDWEACVKDKISERQCRGVVFYIGKHTLLSQALENEQKIIMEKCEQLGKPISAVMFSVNLSRDIPSKILINTVRETDSGTLTSCSVDDERMITFLSMFTDKRDFVPRADARDAQDIIRAIRQKFGTDIMEGTEIY